MAAPTRILGAFFLTGAGLNEHRDELSVEGTICQATNERDETTPRERRASEVSSQSEKSGFDAAARASGGGGVTLSQMLNESLSTPYEISTFATQCVSFAECACLTCNAPTFVQSSVSVPYAKRQKRLNPKRVKEAQWREMTKDAPSNSDR